MSVIHLILLCAVSAPFALAIWAALLRWRLAPPVPPPETEPRGAFAQTGITLISQTLDLPVLLRSVADGLHSLAHTHYVRIDLAVSPGRSIRANPDVLRKILHETITCAVRAADGGQVLVSVLPLGTQLHIVVTDDGTLAAPGFRQSAMRRASELLALLGGTATIDARPGHGTTVTLRLPSPKADVPAKPADAAVLVREAA